MSHKHNISHKLLGFDPTQEIISHKLLGFSSSLPPPSTDTVSPPIQLHRSPDPLFANHTGPSKLLLPLGIEPFTGEGDVPGAKEFLIDRAEEALARDTSTLPSTLQSTTQTQPTSTTAKPRGQPRPFPSASHRPSTAASILLLPRLEPHDYTRPSTTAASNRHQRDQRARSQSMGVGVTTTRPGFGWHASSTSPDNNPFAKTATKRRGKPSSKKKLKTNSKKTPKKKRPNTAPETKSKGGRRRRHGSIGTASGMLIDRPSPQRTQQRTQRPATSNASSRKRNNTFHNSPDRPDRHDTPTHSIVLRKEDIQRYKRMLTQDVFAPRTKMLKKRLELTFLMPPKTTSLLSSMLHPPPSPPTRTDPSMAPRLLSVLLELIELIRRCPNVAGQLITGGVVPLISSAAWLFGAVDKGIEQTISETASQLLYLFAKSAGMACHLCVHTQLVSTLGGILLSGIGNTLIARAPEQTEPTERNDPRNDTGYDLAHQLRQTSSWAALRPYQKSFTETHLPTDHAPSTIRETLQHTAKQVQLAVLSLGYLSTRTEQLYLKSGDASGWRRFLECGGLEYLIIAGSDGTVDETTLLPIGTLNSLCPSFLDTSQCHRRTTKNNSTTSRQSTCSCMHLTGVYPTLSGVTSAGDMYIPTTAHPSPSLERVRTSHRILQLQFTVQDIQEMKQLRKDRVVVSTSGGGGFIAVPGQTNNSSTSMPSSQLHRTKHDQQEHHHQQQQHYQQHQQHHQQQQQQHATTNRTAAGATLSVRASLLCDQLSNADPSAALALTRFGTGPRTPPHASPLHASPLHASPLHASPLHASPLHVSPPHVSPQSIDAKTKEKEWIQRYNHIDGSDKYPVQKQESPTQRRPNNYLHAADAEFPPTGHNNQGHNNQGHNNQRHNNQGHNNQGHNTGKTVSPNQHLHSPMHTALHSPLLSPLGSPLLHTPLLHSLSPSVHAKQQASATTTEPPPTTGTTTTIPASSDAPQTTSPSAMPRRQRNKGVDCERLLALHCKSILVGNEHVEHLVTITVRQHLEWLRRLIEKRKRLAIEAEEWKIIRQQRIAVKINRMQQSIRRAAQRDPHEDKLVGALLQVFAQSCLKFQHCNHRAHAEVANQSSTAASHPRHSKPRQSTRTDSPHMWVRATKKVPYSRCHHCHVAANGLLRDTITTTTTAAEAAGLSLEYRNIQDITEKGQLGTTRNFLTATALGLRFRNWLTQVNDAFLRMNLPLFYQEWLIKTQINNEKDCGIAGYRLSKHAWFVNWCGTMLKEPKCLRNRFSQVETIDIIIVGGAGGGTSSGTSSSSSMSGSKEMQRKKSLSLPRGVDPSRYGWPGVSLQG